MVQRTAYGNQITAHVFELSEATSTEVYDLHGNYIGAITITPIENTYRVEIDNLEKVAVIFRNREVEGLASHELGARLYLES